MWSQTATFCLFFWAEKYSTMYTCIHVNMCIYIYNVQNIIIYIYLFPYLGYQKYCNDYVAVVIESLSRVWLFCDHMDCIPKSSAVSGIFQARILEWVAISFSRGSSHPRGWSCASWTYPELAGRFFTTEPLRKPVKNIEVHISFQNCVYFLWINTQKWDNWVIW